MWTLGMRYVIHMPLIEIKMWDGKDQKTVNKIIALQTEAMCEAIGCPPEAVRIIVHQIPKSHWGIAGKPTG